MDRFNVEYPNMVAGKDQPDKCAAVAVLNPDLNCSICTWPLTMGPSTAFAHLNHQGGKERGEGNNRPEIRQIAAGKHPHPELVTWMCSNCNNEHNTWVTVEALIASPRVQKLRRQAEILRELGEM